MKNWQPSFLKALSAVLGNLSAGWFGVAIIVPNFVNPLTLDGFLILTRDVAFGIVFLAATVIIERILHHE